jgi:hypothetical protein
MPWNNWRRKEPNDPEIDFLLNGDGICRGILFASLIA